jgi:hypothetical protein
MNTILVSALVAIVSALVAYKCGIRKGADNLASAKTEAAQWKELAESRGSALEFQRGYRRQQELKALNLR